MLLFVDNQHSCLKAYAVTLLDGCFSEARSAVIRINVDPRGGKKKKRKKRWLFRVSNESMLDQTSNATNASALDKENYARAYLVLYRLSIVQFFFLGGRGNWKRHSCGVQCGYYNIFTRFHLSGASEQNFVDFWSTISDRKYPIKYI